MSNEHSNETARNFLDSLRAVMNEDDEAEVEEVAFDSNDWAYSDRTEAFAARTGKIGRYIGYIECTAIGTCIMHGLPANSKRVSKGGIEWSEVLDEYPVARNDLKSYTLRLLQSDIDGDPPRFLIVEMISVEEANAFFAQDSESEWVLHCEETGTEVYSE